MIQAKVIADSVTLTGKRLTTMEVQFHRFILAEFNTHRAFSRNSASSRAIPVEKILERVVNDPAYPIYWGTEKKGMSPGDELFGDNLVFAKRLWENARLEALYKAARLTEIDLHKSLCNRLLEPFMWHTAIVSATDWANFFHQRCSPAAQPEMRELAEKMKAALEESKPVILLDGEWHLPYCSLKEHWEALYEYDEFPRVNDMMRIAKSVSVARCARVSYLNHDGTLSIGKDLELYDKLVTGGHWSPFEHVATPSNIIDGRSNFRGWEQLRYTFEGQNIDQPDYKITQAENKDYAK